MSKKEDCIGIGIDLATTFSYVRPWVDDRDNIEQQANPNPRHDVARFIGRVYSDQQLQKDMQQYSFKIAPDANNQK